MKNILYALLFLLFVPAEIFACSMFKITKGGKTIVGNNEDWWNPITQIWFEPKQNKKFGYMAVGFHDNFAQGAVNDGGLMFDGFAMPFKPTIDTSNKKYIEISKVISTIMHNYSSVEDVKKYLEKINLKDLTNSMLVFIDKDGKYLRVESDELFLGNEEQQSFSNFFPSLTSSTELVDLPFYQNGCKFIKSSIENTANFSYVTSVMDNFKQTSTQYTTIYDLKNGIIKLFHFHNFKNSIEINLVSELKKGKHTIKILNLFPKNTEGHKNYKTYLDTKSYVDNQRKMWFEHTKGKDSAYIKEAKEGFIYITNRSANDWLEVKGDIKRATAILNLLVELFPNDVDGYLSLGKSYFKVKNYNQAKKYFIKVIELDTSNETAKKMLTAVEISALNVRVFGKK